MTAQNTNDDTDTPDPRRKFASDLISLCNLLSQAGNGIILFMDANSSLNDTHSWLHELLQKTGLHDIYSHRHGYDEEPATYVRGTKRIDFMFATSDFLPYIASSGYTSFANTSDHRTMYCDIHIKQYLKEDPPPDIDSISFRNVLSKYKKMRTQYKKEVLTHLTEQHYQDTIIKLAQTAQATGQLTDLECQQLNEVDRLITNTMKTTEDNMRRKYHHPWSPILLRYIKMVHFWKSWISELKTAVDYSQTRAEIRLCFDDPTMLPNDTPTIETAHQQFRLSKKQPQLMFKQADCVRNEWLLSQEDIARDAGDKVRAEILKNIRKSEPL